jgi:lipid II:glycine glycyltransferase (peptidoglycan interpeptide bridge formation enzyme)
MLETTSRDNFSGHTIEYYKNFLKILKQSRLLLAFSDDKVIA